MAIKVIFNEDTTGNNPATYTILIGVPKIATEKSPDGMTVEFRKGQRDWLEEFTPSSDDTAMLLRQLAAHYLGDEQGRITEEELRYFFLEEGAEEEEDD